MNRAVYTYFCQNKSQQRAGFLSTKELAYFLSLSVAYARKHFRDVVLYTDDAGKELLIDKYKIGFTSVSTELNELKISPDLWAYAKVVTYSLQKEPFVHIDLDCVLWDKLPQNVAEAKLFFQNKEEFCEQRAYQPLIDLINGTTVSYYCKSQNINHAYNAGVVGCNDLSLVAKWKGIVDDFIFNPVNAYFWKSVPNHSQFNYIFEQYFIACICNNDKVLDDVKFLINNFTYEEVSKPEFPMTHLWGESKKCIEDMNKIKARLKREFPDIYDFISSFEEDEHHLFECLYDKGGDKYKALLKDAIKTKDIKSVVYLGYEGVKSSRYVDVSGKQIDFLYSRETKNALPECDLLIIKDMMLLWTGEEYTEFVSGNLQAKYILDAKEICELKS